MNGALFDFLFFLPKPIIFQKKILKTASKQFHPFYETKEDNTRNNTSVCNDDEDDEKKAKSEVMEKLMILITHFDGK